MIFLDRKAITISSGNLSTFTVYDFPVDNSDDITFKGAIIP